MPIATVCRKLATTVLPLLLLACGGGAPSPGEPAAGITDLADLGSGPIVLVTFGALRADVVGGLGGPPGLTPNLDALIRQADWAGRAIATTSRAEPALASLWTGLRPWQHQVLHGGSTLSPDLLTLAEALGTAGYSTTGFPGGPWYSQAEGFAQGFDTFDPADRGRGAAARLRRLVAGDEGRQFVWVHIPEPQAPYVLRRRLLPRLERLGGAGGMPRELPARVRPIQLEPYFDPGVPLPEGRRRRFWAMYLLNVAWADEKLGRLVEALRASGQWDRTLLAVAGVHGEEFGERGQIGHGGNLGRRLLEVPLVVKLPQGKGGRRIAVPKGERVAAVRLWATLVEAAGGPLVPAAAPSLFRPAPWPALSELYLNNGTNAFSLVEGGAEGDWQLLWESRFAPPEPGYYRARFGAMAGGPPDPDNVFARLQSAFAAVPPLTGLAAEPPRLTLERWGPGEGAGSQAVSDPRRTAEMARRLAAAWSTFVPGELPPGLEARERGVGSADGRPGESPGLPF